MLAPSVSVKIRNRKTGVVEFMPLSLWKDFRIGEPNWEEVKEDEGKSPVPETKTVRAEEIVASVAIGPDSPPPQFTPTAPAPAATSSAGPGVTRTRGRRGKDKV